MSERERAVTLLQKVPEYKISYILGVIEGALIPDETPNAETLSAFAEGDHMLEDCEGERFTDMDLLRAAMEA